MTFTDLLKKVDPELFRQYVVELYGKKDVVEQETSSSTDETLRQTMNKISEIRLPSIESLPDDHYAKWYIKNRKIPTIHYKRLYYAEDFKKFIDGLSVEHGRDLKENDPRIIIPFFDENKTLIALQGRALQSDAKSRYMSIKFVKEAPKLFGMDRIDQTKRVYVVEGPFDSLFLDNCIATADSILYRVGDFLQTKDIVLIYDNEPRNKQIVGLMNGSIDRGFKVCIWPDSVEGKDINDIVLSGFTPPEIQAVIDYNTYEGLSAKLRLNTWKKC